MRTRLLLPILLVAMLAGANAASAATITPSHVTAGHSTGVSVTLAGCPGTTLKLSGSVIPGGVTTLTRHGGKYTGHLVIKPGAASGAHFLGLRCAGANAGSVKVTVTGAPGGAKIRLGWVYTAHQVAAETDHEPHVGQITLTSAACKKRGGKQLVFPSSIALYNARTSTAPEFKLGSGGKFRGDMYVGTTLHPGPLTVSARCESKFGLTFSHVHFHFTVVRHPFPNYKTPGQKHAVADHLALPSTHEAYATFHTGANNSNDPAEMLSGTPRTLSVPACEDPRALTLKITSAGLSPHTQTSVKRIGSARPDTDIFGAFSTLFNFTDVVAGPTPGLFPVKLSCGTGLVATGKIRIKPAG